jgi:D-arginine dehydrogenase
MLHFDYLVIGARAAGASVAYELSKVATVALIEREIGPGYHSTGRSAAVISENYGPLAWQALVIASRSFLEMPPPGFAAHSLLHQIAAVYLAAPDNERVGGSVARAQNAQRSMPASPRRRGRYALSSR